MKGFKRKIGGFWVQLAHILELIINITNITGSNISFLFVKYIYYLRLSEKANSLWQCTYLATVLMQT